MARTLNRLKAAKLQTTKSGMYPDGGGLWLQVTSRAGRSWLFRYRVVDPTHPKGYRERYHGLGPAHTISLDEAREKARECRKLRLAGIDPIEHREAEHRQRLLEAAKSMTFDQCAAAYVEAHESAWTNPVHRRQWRNTLRDYVSPILGPLPVQSIDTGLVLKVIEPLWKTVPETASRLRGRIESVLDWATARNYRTGDNPARWKGHLDHLLPARTKVRKVKHHAAMPYTELPDFMTSLRAQEGVGARCLEFAILTAARSGEALGARWNEIRGGVWTIPAERMKAGKEHRVPLSKAALAILDQVPRGGDFVFPGVIEGRGLSHDTLQRVLLRIRRDDITVHGFRSTFRTWAAERTSYAHEICEAVLAHGVPEAVVRSYQRTDFFDKRGRLMDEWGRYCTNPAPAGKVIPMGAVSA